MEDLTLSSSNYSAKGSQSEALGLKGRFYPNRLHSPPLGRGWGWVLVYAPEGALICQLRATPGGGRMQHGYTPEGGKRITAHHYRVAKGVSGIIILLPILGECWLRTIPKALPWADLFLAFLSPLCFESEQARAQAVFTPTVYTPLPWGNRRSRFACRRMGLRVGVLVQADMLSACMEYEDILSDKQRPTTYS